MSKIEKWIPDRKFIAGGLAGLVAWILVAFLGISDVELAMQIGLGAMAAVYYLVPPSIKDLARRADDALKAKQAVEAEAEE